MTHDADEFSKVARKSRSHNISDETNNLKTRRQGLWTSFSMLLALFWSF
jgi:hypothetical protein